MSFRASLSFRAQAEGRSRGIETLRLRGPSFGTIAIPRLAALARNDNSSAHRRFVCIVAMLAVWCTAASGRETNEIRLWAMGREGEVVAQLIPDFEREHPGVHVRVQQIPWS